MTPADKNSVSVLYSLEKDVTRIDRDIVLLKGDVVDLQVSVARLGAKVSVFAGLGAIVGGALISLLTRFF